MRELSQPIDLNDEDRDYVEAALAGLNAPTRTAYARDLIRFSLFFDAGAGGRLQVLDRFLLLDATAAHAIAWNYREDMLRAALGPATINRRLSALRAFCRRARQTGRIVWSLEVPGLDAAPARLYLIPPGDVAHLIAQLSTGPAALEPRRARDACAIRLTWDLGFRSGELLSIDVDDVELSQGLVHVRRKGATGKRAMQLPERSQNALARWITARREAGPLDTPALFVQYETHPQVGRLSSRGFYKMVRTRTRQILGKEYNPHALRHAAITFALEVTNGNVARVATGFAHHADPRTTMRYDDMRQADGAAIAQLVSESVPEPLPEPSSFAIASFSARASASARASVGLQPRRSSAERSAVRASSSFEGRATTLGDAGGASRSCTGCGTSDGGRDGFLRIDGADFCSDCWGD